MSKSTVFEFEATLNNDGEFTCNSFTEVPSEISSGQSDGSADFTDWQQGHQQQQQQQQQHQQQQGPYNQYMTDEIFKQSYNSNFTNGNTEYLNQMRQQFEQMRQSMLDNMETFTFVKNVRR